MAFWNDDGLDQLDIDSMLSMDEELASEILIGCADMYPPQNVMTTSKRDLTYSEIDYMGLRYLLLGSKKSSIEVRLYAWASIYTLLLKDERVSRRYSNERLLKLTENEVRVKYRPSASEPSFTGVEF